MQEFSIELKSRINFALRKDFRAGRDNVGLISLFNSRHTAVGLRQHEPPAIPAALQSAMTSAGITVAHPFPQLFRGKTQSFLLTATELYSVASNWALTQISTFNPETHAADTITTGSSWHFADFKDSYVFFNGVCSIIKWKLDSLYGTADVAYVFTTPFINTGVDFAGRVVFGGFTDGVWKDDWLAFWNNFDLNHQISASFAIANNSVMWTSVAGSELWWLVRPSLVLEEPDGETTLKGSKDKVIQMLKSNQFGWKELEHDVLKILPLGENCVVYGSNGITLMFPTQAGNAPTFGFKQISDMGIIGRSAAVQAGIGQHVFVDAEGVFHKLSASGVEDVGYEEFLSPMVGADVVLSFDSSSKKDVYISDDTDCFLYSKTGELSEVSRLYTSLAFVGGVTVGILEDTSVDTFELITDVLNFGVAGKKTITSVEVICTDTQGITVALDYAHTKTQSFTRTSFITANNEGVAHIKAHGYDFRVVIRSADYTKIDVDDIIVRVQYDDKRNVRGLVGNERGVQNVS